MKVTRRKKNGYTITTKWMNLTEYKQSSHYNDFPKVLLDNEELIKVLKSILEKKFIKEYGPDGLKPIVSYERDEPELDELDDDDFFKDL